MVKIVSVSPLGFNIKTKKGIIFAGEKLSPPFAENIEFDIQNNPHRWTIEYEKESVLKMTEDIVIEEDAPELKKSDTKKSEASIAGTARTKSRRRKITTR